MRTWSKTSLYLAAGLTILGFVLMFLAWNGAAEKDFIQGQFPYLLSGGLPGLALVFCGLTVAIIQGARRDVLELQDKLEELLAERAAASAPIATLTAVPDSDDVFLATATAYHRSGCRTVAGRAGLELVAPEDVEARGLKPCRVCRPMAQTA